MTPRKCFYAFTLVMLLWCVVPVSAQNNGVRTLLSRAGFVRTGTEAGTSEWERNACPVVTVA